MSSIMANPERKKLDPDAKKKLGRAFAWVIGLSATGIGIVGAFTIWHLSRRARLIRETSPPPKPITLWENSEPPEN